MIKNLSILMALLFCLQSGANEDFADSEANFKLVMQKLMSKYIDKNLSKDELYHAATAGMLSSLNSKEQTWNKLLSPSEIRELESDLSGKVSGIGIEMKFDTDSGIARVLSVIPNSPAEKAGLKMDDQILSVNDVRFKGKLMQDLVSAVRGTVGKSVNLKILREDNIIKVAVTREVIPWTPVELQKVTDSTSLLTIGYFNETTPDIVEAKLKEVNRQKVMNLVIDMRGNAGGGFDQAVKTAGLFLPKDSIVVTTKSRDGKALDLRSTQTVLDQNVHLIVLTNGETSSGAELFTAALRENKMAKVVGQNTFGKWNAQVIEILPNKFAVKYTVASFQSPQGKSYQGTGLKPDLEVTLPKDIDIRELQTKYEISKRIDVDTQLKAALELTRSL